MSLFQPSIIKKYLKNINQNQVDKAWGKFQSHFQNLTIQQNIIENKEENYQYGFLEDFFVKVLGYTLNPQPDYNLTTEFKNQTGSKKADGAILKDGKAIGVIELKSTKIKDLTKITEQAFNYKNNQSNCRYVITSTFEKLRFYIDNAVEFVEFDLFRLSRDDFNYLYLILNHQSMMSDLPNKLKSESISQEEAITFKLYKDYSLFKQELFGDLIANNTQIDALELFKKSQKLLDRFLFIFFAEDRGLLPPNFALNILTEWEEAKKLKLFMPLYEKFKHYFEFLDKGYKDNYTEIFAYNGGLFKPDILLDSLKISDVVISTHIKKLADYDFSSEIDVNILGHIFENSLNELDEIKAKLNGEKVEKTATKRKKDGVFYTPSYITKYIIENTLGKLCEAKKAEFNIIDENYEYVKIPAKTAKSYKKIFDQQTARLKVLNEYREWLLTVTICDPACGSGAFLNEALNFLISEHEYIDQLTSRMSNSSFIFPDIENSILEKNIYGVDINEESVEIAKLSLWLRTAKPRRKLNNLSNNILQGNSLIDDPTVAGDIAFDWKEKFPQVFDKGGFDVVVGNPPWGAKVPKEHKDFINKKYISKKGELETYVHFIDLGVNSILKSDGLLGYITPNTWYYLDKYIEIRKLLIKLNIYELIELEKNIFGDAPDIVPAIFFVEKNKNIKEIIKTYSLNKGSKPTFIKDSNFKECNVNKADMLEFNDLVFNLSLTKEKKEILLKIMKSGKELNNFYNIRYGIKTGNNKKYLSDNQFDNNWKKCISAASGVKKYNLIWEGDYLHYGNHLSGYSAKSFEVPKILIQYIRKLSMDTRLVAAFDEDGIYYPLNNFSFVEEKNELFSLYYVLSLINSKMFNFYFKNMFIDYNIKPKYIEKLPIKEVLITKQKPLIEKAKEMLHLNKEMNETIDKFLRILERRFDLTSPSKALKDWPSLDYKGFIKELCNKKIKLSLSVESEWEEFFSEQKTKANILRAEIVNTDQIINQMVYDLYGLNPNEIHLIESDL